MPKKIIKLALEEDLVLQDLSSLLLDTRARAKIIAKEAGIMTHANLPALILDIYYEDFAKSKSEYKIEYFKQDSQSFEAFDCLMEIEAEAKALLALERTILNFLQRLTAIATKARQLSQIILKYNCLLLDTRKSSPGLRFLEKQAFANGGGTNHRLNLSDMAMLKENHLALIEDLGSHIPKLRQAMDVQGFTQNKIEIEINEHNLDKLESLINTEIDIVMLDNFASKDIPELINKIRKINPRIKIELSGGITEANLEAYAKTGPDYISMGSCFTKAGIIDLSMLIYPQK